MIERKYIFLLTENQFHNVLKKAGTEPPFAKQCLPSILSHTLPDFTKRIWKRSGSKEPEPLKGVHEIDTALSQILHSVNIILSHQK